MPLTIDLSTESSTIVKPIYFSILYLPVTPFDTVYTFTNGWGILQAFGATWSDLSLHHRVVIFFWSSGIMDCMLFTFE